MFVGHFGLGFGAKKVRSDVSLGALFAAAQFADLLWPTLVVIGLEHVTVRPGATVMTPLDFVSYPYSHSLEALCIWGVLFGAGYLAATRSSVGAAGVLAALVVSHWLLDFVVHRPDLPLTFGGTSRFGLGLWNSVAAALAIEFGLFVAGFAIYLRATIARDRAGSIGLWLLVAFLVVAFVAATFGPPPPDDRAVAWSAEAMWLLVVWGYWIDRHRAAV